MMSYRVTQTLVSHLSWVVQTREGPFKFNADVERGHCEISVSISRDGNQIISRDSPVEPGRIHASQTSGGFGQVIQRSDDGGRTWESKRVRWLKSGLDDSDTVYQ